jgi:CheY-like chemotaxis protein
LHWKQGQPKKLSNTHKRRAHCTLLFFYATWYAERDYGLKNNGIAGTTCGAMLCACRAQKNMEEKLKKILLVEDDPFLSSLLKNRFAQEKVEVMHAHDGDEALAMLKTATPDVVLLDLILPKKSGFEVLQAMREDPQLANAPVIIISNLGQPEDIEKGQQLGAIEYFIKAKTSIEDLVGNVLSFLTSEKG